MGLKIYVNWGGWVFTPPLLNTQNHCEKTIFFAFQIGHIEIGSLKILGCLDAIFRDIGQCFQSKCIRMNVTIAAFFLPSTSIQGAIIPPNLPKNDELPIPEVLT